MNRYARWYAGLLPLLVLAAGCAVVRSASSANSAPQVHALFLTPTASPDTLPRDGHATSLVQLFVRDDQDRAVAGQRFSLRTTIGTLSATDVTTDSNGVATVRFTAPPATTSVSSAMVVLTPESGDRSVISGARTVAFGLFGSGI